MFLPGPDLPLAVRYSCCNVPEHPLQRHVGVSCHP